MSGRKASSISWEPATVIVPKGGFAQVMIAVPPRRSTCTRPMASSFVFALLAETLEREGR